MGTSDRLFGSSTKTDSFEDAGRETPAKKLTEDVSNSPEDYSIFNFSTLPKTLTFYKRQPNASYPTSSMLLKRNTR